FIGSYQATDTLKLGTGYWLRFTEPDTVEIEGMQVDTVDVEVLTGWNMIAGPSCNVQLVNVQDPGGIIIGGTLYSFDGVYQAADSLKQGEGYWIRVSADGVLRLICGLTIARSLSEIGERPLENLARLNASDAKGREQILYFITDATQLESDSPLLYQFSLPPLPPAGTFDIRFEGDSRLAGAGETPIFLRGITYPLTIGVDNLPDAYGSGFVLKEMAGDREIFRHTLNEGEEILITDSEKTHLLLSRVKLTPTKFAVDQNYPNPFNPITTIRYALPNYPFEGGRAVVKVKISIYNIAGRLIKTLVDKRQDSGYYSVVWDGRNNRGHAVTNGTYFYRVKVGKNEITKKMVLLK
ncbi:MAG: T9SS type A sorting domain-containing protein, partial [Planctomycetes bacterium]|nr:T9SS type A sorting domain-containing protein [Planctomycetota bacterium]